MPLESLIGQEMAVRLHIILCKYLVRGCNTFAVIAVTRLKTSSDLTRKETTQSVCRDLGAGRRQERQRLSRLRHKR